MDTLELAEQDHTGCWQIEFNIHSLPANCGLATQSHWKTQVLTSSRLLMFP